MKTKAFVAVVLLLGAGVAGVVWFGSRAPTDTEVSRRFLENQARLEQCATEFDSSEKWRLSAAECAENASRAPECCSAMKEAGVLVITRFPDGTKAFTFWAFGAPGSNRKGVAWVSGTPAVVESLESAPASMGDARIVYRHIEGHWYLFFERG